jgi:crossover junction endodeoxyribonuclease RusA
LIQFWVYGHAQPAGSKTAMPIRRKDGSYVTTASGKPVVPLVDANRKAAGWKQEVKEAARKAYSGPLLDEAVRVRIAFVRVRPKGHYRTGKNAHLLKDDAPSHPTSKPDVLKLARGVEDAMTGIIYRDDSATVSLEVEKFYGEPECCIVTVERVGRNHSVSTEALRSVCARVVDHGCGVPDMRMPGLRDVPAISSGDRAVVCGNQGEVESRGTREASEVGAPVRCGASDSESHVVAQPQNDTH